MRCPQFAKWFPYEGDENPQNATQSEMYLRWLQFATFAPVFRTHCQKEPIPQANVCDPDFQTDCVGCERRIWMFAHHFPIMKAAMVLRNNLGPCKGQFGRGWGDFGKADLFLPPVLI